jgi:hypothetical protein
MESYSSEQHDYALTDEGLQMHVIWRGPVILGTETDRPAVTSKCGVLQKSE